MASLHISSGRCLDDVQAVVRSAFMQSAASSLIVFRAKDQTTLKLLAYYMLLCMKAGSPRRHLDIILDTTETFREWQGRNLTKVPDSETSRSWRD